MVSIHEVSMAKEWAIRFYKSGAWGIARGIALRRDHFCCTRCGRRADEVHHIIALTPENIMDDRVALNIDNLECLCHDCHTKETKGCEGDTMPGMIFDADGQIVLL